MREIMGWVLVALGLCVFYLCLVYLSGALIFEASILSVIGIFVFRGGIHLLKVAVAARVAMQVQSEPPKPTPLEEKKRSTVPWDW